MSESRAPAALDDALRAVSHSTRRAILRLTSRDSVPATELADRLDISPATTSEHLRVLRKAGLVDLSASGTFRRYRANPARMREVLDALAEDISLDHHPHVRLNHQAKEPT